MSYWGKAKPLGRLSWSAPRQSFLVVAAPKRIVSEVTRAYLLACLTSPVAPDWQKHKTRIPGPTSPDRAAVNCASVCVGRASDALIKYPRACPAELPVGFHGRRRQPA